MRRIKKSGRSKPAAAKIESPMGDRIIGVAFKLFMENGYAGTSMLEIATQAKVSKRDLYANFADKHAVLLACITNRAARMRLSPNLPAPRSREMLASTLTSFATTVVREVCQPVVMAMFRLAIAEAERSPEVAETLNTSRSANRRALVGLFAQAQVSGILSHGDPQQMMEQFFALLWGDLMLSLFLDVISRPKPAEIGKRAERATKAFLKLYGTDVRNLSRQRNGPGNGTAIQR